MGSGSEQLTAQTMLNQVTSVVFSRFTTPSMPWLTWVLVQAALDYPSHLVMLQLTKACRLIGFESLTAI